MLAVEERVLEWCVAWLLEEEIVRRKEYGRYELAEL